MKRISLLNRIRLLGLGAFMLLAPMLGQAVEYGRTYQQAYALYLKGVDDDSGAAKEALAAFEHLHQAAPDDPLTRAARAGTLHRNFQGYTTDATDTLIGIGASSIGKLPGGYVQNTPALRDYQRLVMNNGFAVHKGVMISTEDKMRREIIERLMCDLTVDLGEILEKYGQPSDLLAPEISRLEPYEEDGLLTRDGSRLIVSEQGRFLVRTICAVFDTYFGKGPGKHSRAV